MIPPRDLAAAQELLDTPLPPEIEDLHFQKQQFSTDLSLYWAYLKFRTSREKYLDLMARMDMRVYQGSNPELRMLLPGQWKMSPGPKLDWWDPSLDIPDDTAMRTSGSSWAVAKYERGYVYVKLKGG